MKLECNHLHSCRGCPLSEFEFDQQKKIKIERLNQSLQSHLSSRFLATYDSSSVFPVFDHYRTRCDFVFFNGHLGWYGKDKMFLPIEDCVLQTPELTQFARAVSKHNWPIAKGSMRFRIAPDKTKGIWLDLANIDIKTLLDSGQILSSLMNDGVIIEMGQKGKRVQKAGDKLKLIDPVSYPWFTSLYHDQKVELSALISSFTQTNPDVNVQMIRNIKSALGDEKYSEIVEFGCGVGNFTLFLSEMTAKMCVIENDFRNLIPLKENLETYGLTERVEIFESVNRYLHSSKDFTNTLYYVNPARSGVGALFNEKLPATDVLYVSCHLESFLTDVKKLDEQGFQLKSITLFDQFPHSNHFEIIAKITRGSE